MASLQARHSRNCSLFPWTPFRKATKSEGCTCTPLYHVVHRHDGKLIRDPVGHDRKNAERALSKRNVELDEHEYAAVKDIRFNEWADEWLTSLQGKQATAAEYATTLKYASQVFGPRKVRDLGPGDVRHLLEQLRGRGSSPATQAKHLRQLGACLQAAVTEGYTSKNAVRLLHKSARPKVSKSLPVFYTDAELARLWPELAERPVMLALCKTAVATGMRIGELSALRWSDVDLLNREVHVRHTYSVAGGEETPKSGESRTLDLTPPAGAMLEAWYAESRGDDTDLVFERETGGYMTSDYVTRSVLYPALERAGIPREGESGRKRDFHSFRHTFARIALAGGAEITWVKEQLGHSSINITVDTYGGWSRASRKKQAEQLADAFAF
jgi:integrase